MDELERAIRMGANEWTPRTIAYARNLLTLWAVDRPLSFWVAHLHEYDEAHRDLPDDELHTSYVAAGLDDTQPSEYRGNVGVISAEPARDGTMIMRAVEDGDL